MANLLKLTAIYNTKNCKAFTMFCFFKEIYPLSTVATIIIIDGKTEHRGIIVTGEKLELIYK